MVAEQVDIFATAAIVAGPVGSAFHAVLLSTAPRAKLILVQRPGIERTFHDAVARALDLEQYCLDPDLEPFSESHPWARFTLADPSGLADMVCHLADVVAG
jgi:capsular polysaccharide biosynthesis protein